MRSLQSILAWAICALVAVQAAVHAWSSAGIARFLQSGGAIDVNSDAPPDFPEFTGLIIHAMNGMYLIPLVAVALVIVALVTRVGVRLAVIVLALVVVQVVLGFLGHSLTFMALLHGLNAMVLFAAAFLAARAVRAPAVARRVEEPRVPVLH